MFNYLTCLIVRLYKTLARKSLMACKPQISYLAVANLFIKLVVITYLTPPLLMGKLYNELCMPTDVPAKKTTKRTRLIIITCPSETFANSRFNEAAKMID